MVRQCFVNEAYTSVVLVNFFDNLTRELEATVCSVLPFELQIPILD